MDGAPKVALPVDAMCVSATDVHVSFTHTVSGSATVSHTHDGTAGTDNNSDHDIATDSFRGHNDTV